MCIYEDRFGYSEEKTLEGYKTGSDATTEIGWESLRLW